MSQLRWFFSLLCLHCCGFLNGLIPFEKWQCGYNVESRRLSYETMLHECYELIEAFNECCLAHDQCYIDQLGQATCDKTFCDCLHATVQKEKVNKACQSNAFWGCIAVELFGKSAYEASAPSVSSEKTSGYAMSTLSPKDETTPVICVIDDPGVHVRYREAVSTCPIQQAKFVECCQEHMTCNRTQHVSSTMCHERLGTCLRSHVKEDLDGLKCSEALQLIYSELASNYRQKEKKGFMHTVRFWISQLHWKTKSQQDWQLGRAIQMREVAVIAIAFLIAVFTFLIATVVFAIRVKKTKHRKPAPEKDELIIHEQ